MKKFFFPAILVVILCGFSVQDASSKIRVPYGDYEKLKKVYDLPQEEAYEYEDDKYFDIGVKYTVFQIAWIPLYQTEETQLIGYIGEGDTYIKLDEDDIALLAELTGIEDIKSLIKIPFWDAWGGKLIAALVLIFIIYSFIPGKKDE